MTSQRIFTASNLLSLSRAFLVIPVMYFFNKNTLEGNLLGLLFAIIGVLTDFLDGFLARRLNQVSELGKIIDPLADKIAVVGLSVFLAIKRDLPMWYLSIVFTRDILILLCGLYAARYRGIVMQSNIAGKMTVMALAITIILFLLKLHPFTWVFFWGSVWLMGISLIEYFNAFYTVLRREKL